MKRAITVVLAIALMAIPAITAAHIETWAQYDQRLEKQVAELQDKLPIIEKDDDTQFELAVTSVEKNGKVITTTLETTGEHGFIAIAEDMGGAEKFKALMQRKQASEAIMGEGLKLSRRYTLRYRYVDKGKEVCTVDVSALIIHSMILDFHDLADLPEYTPAPLPEELWEKRNEYEKYLKDGGYPPAMTTEELHTIREFIKYSKIAREKETQ